MEITQKVEQKTTCKDPIHWENIIIGEPCTDKMCPALDEDDEYTGDEDDEYTGDEDDEYTGDEDDEYSTDNLEPGTSEDSLGYND